MAKALTLTDVAAGPSRALADRLAAVLTAGELAELAQLIGPDPREHDMCAAAVRHRAGEALERGRAEGWVRCNNEHKAAQLGIFHDLRQERRRWRRVCVACRRLPSPRPQCRDCQDGPRVRFAELVAGEYGGGPVAAW
jgi:hypothetical protein